jgi:hypothetical protein
MERHVRRTRWRSRLVAVFAVGSIIGGVVLWQASTSGPPPGTGDPHGQILRSLDVVAVAVPAGSSDASLVQEEPRWANCPRGESGWYGGPEADAEFLSSSSPEAVRTAVAKVMLDHGWQAGASPEAGSANPYPQGVIVAGWTKALGTVSASAILTKNPDGTDARAWDLSADASPIGPQEGECPQS